MRRDTYFVESDDGVFEDKLIEGEMGDFAGVVINAKDKKKRTRETRRKIELIMEQRRNRELEDGYY